MIKLICFDLDGVLVYSTKELHRKAFREAVLKISKVDISYLEEELEALSTNNKIEKLIQKKLVDSEDSHEINILKQLSTIDLFKDYNFKTNPILFDIAKLAKHNGIKIAVCSNSISATIKLVLNKIKFDSYIDVYFSNEDVVNPKPSPEIYLKAHSFFKVTPEETLIIEDSINGFEAAIKSNSHVLLINSPDDLDLVLERLKTYVSNIT